MTPHPRRLGYPVFGFLFDLGLLVAVERWFPLDWELPDNRLQVALPLMFSALVTAFLVGAYRVEFPIRRGRAVIAGFGLASGVTIVWLLLKLLSQKAGLRELTPPAIEELSLALVIVWVAASLQRLVTLTVLSRLERTQKIGLLGDDPGLIAGLQHAGLTEPLLLIKPDALSHGALESLRALVIATPLTALRPDHLETIAYARGVGLPVLTLTRFEEEVFWRVPLASHDPTIVLDEALERRSALYQSTKRLLDIVFALMLLGFALLPMLVAMVAIRLETRGPVLYRQQRAGLHRRPFTMYKLRTMVVASEPDGPVFARIDDPRVTRVGSWLRRTRMDELPQLINILKNEMSLVGPRPERPEHDRNLAPLIPFYELRTLTRPGLTGWAQVRVGYSDSPERARVKLEHDLYYLKHASLGLDLRILWETVGVVIRGDGR